MTEEEWLSCSDPVQLLDHLNRPQGDRKLFLFALACCRRIWPLLPQPEMRSGIEVAERCAEGKATKEELDAADWELEGALYGGVEYYAGRPGTILPLEIARWSADVQAIPANQLRTMACAGGEDHPTDVLALLTEAGYFADYVLVMNSCQPHSPTLKMYRRFLNLHLLRDVFGNPFRPSALDPTWTTSAVRRLASDIYEERRFNDMPFLGDALEDAGCASPDILNHCRDTSVHVRGCWCLDLVLGKA